MSEDLININILNYYLFQKSIHNHLNNQIEGKDSGKIKEGYIIHPEWIKEWKMRINYNSLNKCFDNLNIKSAKLSKKENNNINSYIKENNIYVESNTSYIIKSNDFMFINEKILSLDYLQNFVDKNTYESLNINKKTICEEIKFILKKKMLILIIENYMTIKILINLTDKDVNLINITFCFYYQDVYKKFFSYFMNTNQQELFEYLRSIDLFVIPKYVNVDEKCDDKTFIVFFEEKYKKLLDDFL